MKVSLIYGPHKHITADVSVSVQENFQSHALLLLQASQNQF